MTDLVYDPALLEWLDSLNIDAPVVKMPWWIEQKTEELVAGILEFYPHGYDAEDAFGCIRRHATCYELTINGNTLVIDRDADNKRGPRTEGSYTSDSAWSMAGD